jgi:hypothetical protein
LAETIFQQFKPSFIIRTIFHFGANAKMHPSSKMVYAAVNISQKLSRLTKTVVFEVEYYDGFWFRKF